VRGSSLHFRCFSKGRNAPPTFFLGSLFPFPFPFLHLHQAVYRVRQMLQMMGRVMLQNNEVCEWLLCDGMQEKDIGNSIRHAVTLQLFRYADSCSMGPFVSAMHRNFPMERPDRAFYLFLFVRGLTVLSIGWLGQSMLLMLRQECDTHCRFFPQSLHIS